MALFFINHIYSSTIATAYKNGCDTDKDRRRNISQHLPLHQTQQDNMPAGDSGGGGAGRGGSGGGARKRERTTKGVSKGTAKFNEEQANKAPSARTQKQADKKAAAKERKEASNTVERIAKKAAWAAEKAKKKSAKFVAAGED